VYISVGSVYINPRKKGQGRTVKKVTKVLYFTYLGRSSHQTDFHLNLHSSCHLWRNHVCKLLNWNFQRLRFYRGSNFPFSYWFLHGPYNSATLVPKHVHLLPAIFFQSHLQERWGIDVQTRRDISRTVEDRG